MHTRDQNKSLELAIQALVILILAAYVVWMLWNPHLGPIDDHELLATVRQHHWLKPFIDPQKGRFFPLDGQELNLVSLFSTSPRAYYAVNAVELLVFSLLFYDICLRLGGRLAASVSLLVLLILPGFATAWLRLLVPERDELLFLTLYLWCYIRITDKASVASFMGAVIAANLALYTKEPVFLLLGTFSAIRLFSAARPSRQPVLALDLLTLLSCAIYVATYYLLVFRHHTRLYSGGMPQLTLFTAIAKLPVSFALNDPLVIFLAAPLAVWRATLVLTRRDTLEPLADPLLAGGVIYAAIFIPLDLFAPHYWLPCYAFILPAFLVYRQRQSATWRKPVILLSSVAAFVLLTAATPSAIAIAAASRYIPRNFTALVATLQQRLTAAGHKTPTGIYLYRIGTGQGIEIAVGLEEYLAFAGVPRHDFAIFAAGPSGRPERYIGGGNFANSPAPGPAAGDFVVRTPFSHDDVDTSYIDLRNRDYTLLWRSRSRHAPGDFGLRALLKRMYADESSRANASTPGRGDDTRDDTDYYVYERMTDRFTR